MGELRKLWIEGPAGKLEATVRVAKNARAAAVVAHPHPLHGGTLHNSVVFHSDRELHRTGFTTLRFNFRGVGSSEGTHDDARGEVGDVEAAVTWLRGIAGDLPLMVVGYSFGSVCGIRCALRNEAVKALVAIGLPVRRFELDGDLAGFNRPLGVVQGSEDEFGSPDEVEPLIRQADPDAILEVIEGAPHLFPRRAQDAAAGVVKTAEALLARL